MRLIGCFEYLDHFDVQSPSDNHAVVAPVAVRCGGGGGLTSWSFTFSGRRALRQTDARLPSLIDADSLVSSQPSPTISCTRRVQRCEMVLPVQLGLMQNGCSMLELHGPVVDSTHWVSACITRAVSSHANESSQTRTVNEASR